MATEFLTIWTSLGLPEPSDFKEISCPAGFSCGHTNRGFEDFMKVSQVLPMQFR